MKLLQNFNEYFIKIQDKIERSLLVNNQRVMSLISNKIKHSVSTMQNMTAKQERLKSRLSASFLNTRHLPPKPPVLNSSKQSLRWSTINQSRSFPLAHTFSTHNNIMVEEIQSSLTELQIIMDRIENKAMNEQGLIEVVYKELKQLQRVVMGQMKEVQVSSQEMDKEQMKAILMKIKSLFVAVADKQRVLMELKQPLGGIREEIEQTYPRLFQNQTKERERQLEEQIDNLSLMMFELESEIHHMRNESIEQHKIFQEKIKSMRDSLVRVIDVIHYLKKEEKSITNYEHDVILQLINSAGEKVVYL